MTWKPLGRNRLEERWRRGRTEKERKRDRGVIDFSEEQGKGT